MPDFLFWKVFNFWNLLFIICPIIREGIMNNQEYENRYNGTIKILRFLGWVALIVCLGCTIVAEVDFFSAMNTWGKSPDLFFLNFIGCPWALARFQKK